MTDPMERLARKIKKDEKLFLRDLKTWIGYNFLVFNETEQEEVKAVNSRQQWFWKYFVVLGPPYWLGSFAYTRYSRKWNYIASTISSTLFVASLSQLGLISSNGDMCKLYGDLYSKYQYECLSPKYRGLKLKTGKKVYQIDEREFTSSNFDDLKEMIFRQKNK